MSGWIAVDLDGTLAKYDVWRGIEHIGEPVLPMLNRVKGWIAQGQEVKIFTARVSDQERSITAIVGYIEAWCIKHGLPALEVTCTKDYGMIELWDDRAVRVKFNEGTPELYIGQSAQIERINKLKFFDWIMVAIYLIGIGAAFERGCHLNGAPATSGRSFDKVPTNHLNYQVVSNITTSNPSVVTLDFKWDTNLTAGDFRSAIFCELKNRNNQRLNNYTWGIDFEHPTNVEFVFYHEPTIVSASNGAWVVHFK